MKANLIAAVREYAREQCRDGANVFGPSFFEEHLEAVADYARRLAPPLGADMEVVELAAYLHDISAVRDAATLPDHARLSAEFARAWLSERGYERAESVARAIASHSSPLTRGTPEEICVSNADAVSQIARPAYWLYFAFTVRKLSFAEGRQWFLDRVESNWRGLCEPAKDVVRDAYTAAKLQWR